MNHNIKLFILFTLSILIFLLFFPLNTGAGDTYCVGDEVWEDGTMIEDCNAQDTCIGTTFHDSYCFYGSCTYADLACSSYCDSPPNLPTLIAPPHNTTIDYVPTFKVQVSDPDNDDVRAHFRIVLYGTGMGNWAGSGGISQWGPVNIGDCAKYEWEAYTEDACGFKSGWTGEQIGYWVVKIDKGVTSSTISYTTGTIGYTTFWVYLEESGGCFGVAEGNVDISIDGGAWQDYSLTINDFSYTGSDGHCYNFRYQVKNNAGEWSDWDMGGEVCIDLCDCTSGSCCSDLCNFDDSSAICDGGYSYQCPATEGCGDDAVRQSWTKYCSGSSAGCDGETEEGTQETFPEGICTLDELCYMTSPYCRWNSGCAAPPARSNGAPSGTLPSGTTSTTISLDVHEMNATCKYDTSPGTPYASMPNTFPTVVEPLGGPDSHQATVIGLSDGNTYSYYVRCESEAGHANLDDFLITFDVATPACQCSNPDDSCCDGCDFNDSSIVCEPEAQEEFQCSSADCGGDYQRRTKDKYCSGSDAGCTGGLGSWSDWSTEQDCSSENQRCSLADGGCIADPTCACVCSSSDGPCCTDNCNFNNTSTVCQSEAEEEFQCSSADCGGDYQRRTKDKYCSGSDAGCTGGLGSWSDWSTEQDCADSQLCSVASPYCQDDPSCAPCECSSGPCCDGCNFKSSSTVCDTEKEYQCSGTGCGADYQSRTKDQYCSGSDAGCTGSYSSWSGWSTEKPCDDTELCSITSPYCQYDSSCGPPPPPPLGLVPCGRCEEWECKEWKENVCVQRNYDKCVDPPSPGVGDPCQLCHFFVLAKNIISHMLKMVLIMATLFIVFGGIMILTGGGSPEPVTKGKKAILFAVIGVVVALVAWIIINSVMVLLADPSAFPWWPWHQIKCP